MQSSICCGFYFPPHPKSKIRRENLGFYEETNKFVAQRKYNGTHVVIHIKYPEVTLRDRRGNFLTLYKLQPSMVENFHSLNLRRDSEYVLNGELLHTKAKSKITGEQAAANTIVLFDILYAHRYLLDVSFMERTAILFDICNRPTKLEPKGRALTVSQHTESSLWLAETYNNDFLYRFDEFLDFHAKTGEDKYPEIEGLMLKQKEGKLLLGDRETDVDWIIRCRKSKPNMYDF